jgi:hypothetical protein
MTDAHPSISTAASTAPARDRPTFTLELRPEPGVDPVLALRALLKVTLRRFGLRCISAHENQEEQS